MGCKKKSLNKFSLAADLLNFNAAFLHWLFDVKFTFLSSLHWMSEVLVGNVQNGLLYDHMSLVMRKPVLGVSDQV